MFCPCWFPPSSAGPNLFWSDTSALIQLPIQDRIFMRERPMRLVAAQAAGVHFQLGIEVVGMMEDEAFRDERQPRRAPLGQSEMRDNQVLKQLQQLGVDVAQLPRCVAHQISGQEQMAE